MVNYHLTIESDAKFKEGREKKLDPGIEGEVGLIMLLEYSNRDSTIGLST